VHLLTRPQRETDIDTHPWISRDSNEIDETWSSEPRRPLRYVQANPAGSDIYRQIIYCRLPTLIVASAKPVATNIVDVTTQAVLGLQHHQRRNATIRGPPSLS